MNRKRGVALTFTLLIMVVLVILLGAFVQTYQSHYAVARQSADSQAARLGCESLRDYIAFRLEHDRGWAGQAFDKVTPAEAFGGVIEATELAGTHRIVGKIPDLNLSFEAEVYSHLTDGVDEEVAGRVLKGKALCLVAVQRGQSMRRVEFTLSVAPLFDSSVLTRADLFVDSEALKMRSRDPERNFVRAEGEISVPNVLSDNRSRFLATDSEEADPNGVLWAKGDIHSLLTSSSSNTIDDAEEVARANQNSGGRVVANANSNYSIYDMDAEQLKLPANQSRVDVPPGRWNFVRVPAEVTYSARYGSAYKSSQSDNDGKIVPYDNRDRAFKDVSTTETIWLDVLEHYDPPDAAKPTTVYRGAYRTSDLIPQMLESVQEVTTEKGEINVDYWLLDPLSKPRTDKFTIAGYEDSDFEIVSRTDGLVFEGENGASFRFDLTNQQVLADPSARVDVEGPLHLTSESRSSEPQGKTPPPVLNLGHVDAEGKVKRATLMARGDIDISEGVTQGLGALISLEGDVRIQPTSASAVDVDASENDTGLVIFSGRNVELGKPDRSNNWSFKGLVYSRGDITMKGKDAENVSFEGAVVSLAESEEGESTRGIRFENCGIVEFIYNRDLLDALVKSMPAGRIQVETLVWKE